MKSIANINRRRFLRYAAGAALLGSSPAKAWLRHGQDNFVYRNFNGSTLSNWAAALAAKNAGTRNAKILCIGDSETVGYKATGGSYTGCRTLSYPAVLAGLLSGGSNSSFFGDGNINSVGNTLPQYNSGVTFSGGWAQDASLGFGGAAFQTSSAGTLAFTPDNQIDTIEVWYETNPSFGSFTVNVDGGSTLATITPTAAASLIKSTITCSLGLHTINLVRATGTVKILGVVAYNSAAKEISIYNAGSSGQGPAQWNATSGVLGYANALTQINPDLILIMTGVNQTDSAALNSAIQTFIALKPATCDVILMSSPPVDIGSVPTATQQAIVDGMISLGYPFINVWGVPFQGSWEVSNAAGYEADNIHPNAAGYALISNLLPLPINNPAYVHA